MTPEPLHSIISGVDYAVRTVNGQPPQRDRDFAGAVSLYLVYDPVGVAVHDEQTIQGLGLVCDDGIFVNEKDGHGKDRRRWQVQHQAGTDAYLARQGLF